MLRLVVLIAELSGAAAAPPRISTEQRIKAADSVFWDAFNACDRARIEAALAPDVEFYHDKTGVTVSREAVVKSLMDGPCGTPGLHVRRELVAGSMSYDAVPGFGAIVTGRHRFYAHPAGQAERLDGEARFAVVWQDRAGALAMRRILSYAHGTASEEPIAQTVEVPRTTLQRYVGQYASPMGEIVVTLNREGLHLASGGLATNLIPASATTFRAQDRPLRFEFVGTGRRSGKVVVRENEAIVTKGIRQNRP